MNIYKEGSLIRMKDWKAKKWFIVIKDEGECFKYKRNGYIGHFSAPKSDKYILVEGD